MNKATRRLMVLTALALGIARAASAEVTFRPVDIYVDSGDTKLAAYQVEVRYDNARVKIVGLEGGETRAFNSAPFYDPAGLEKGRTVIAAFIPEDVDEEEAPAGRTRVARLHLQIEHDAAIDMSITLVVAADAEGRRTGAEVEIVEYTDDGEESGR